MPMKTPTGVPASRSGTSPASSSASQATSSSMPLLRVEIGRLAGARCRRTAASNRSMPVQESAPPREIVLAQLPIVPAAGRDLADRLARRRGAAPRTRPGRRRPGTGSRCRRSRSARGRPPGARGPARRGVAVRGLAGEERRQGLDRGIVVDERRRERPAEPFLELAPRAATACSEPMPKPANGRADDRPPSGRMPSGSATLAASQAAISPASRATAGRDAVADLSRGRIAPREPRRRHGGSIPRRSRASRPGTPRGRRGAGPCRSRSGEARRLDQPDRGGLERRAPRRPPRRMAAEDLVGPAPRPSLRSTSATIASRSSPSTSTANAAAPPVRERGMAAHGGPLDVLRDRCSGPGG